MVRDFLISAKILQVRNPSHEAIRQVALIVERECRFCSFFSFFLVETSPGHIKLYSFADITIIVQQIVNGFIPENTYVRPEYQAPCRCGSHPTSPTQ